MAEQLLGEGLGDEPVLPKRPRRRPVRYRLAAGRVSNNVQTVATGVEEMGVSIKEIARNASATRPRWLR